MTQIGVILYLIANALIPLAGGRPDAYTGVSVAVAVVFLALLWFSWRERPWGHLVAAVLGLVFLLATPFTFSGAEEPVLIWLASLGATLFLLLAIEGFLAFSESIKTQSPA